MIVILGLLTSLVLSGCDLINLSAGDASKGAQAPQQIQQQTPDTQDSSDDSDSVTTPPPVIVIPDILVPVASGIDVEENGQAVIDISNKQDGYIMAKYIEETDMKIKLLISAPDGIQYTYELHPGWDFEVYPLSGGNGLYEIGIWKQVEDSRYSLVLTATIDVVLVDEFAPFLRPNQFVNFTKDSNAVRKAAELTAGADDVMEKVTAIYHFVIKNIVYDVQLAETVQSGYLPDIDKILESGKGICFDYSALMASMLRSQGIPTKLVIGYTSEVKHAWLSVYSEQDGWLDNVIHFNGYTWELVDPTLAAGGSGSNLAAYIGDGSNYIISSFH